MFPLRLKRIHNGAVLLLVLSAGSCKKVEDRSADVLTAHTWRLNSLSINAQASRWEACQKDDRYRFEEGGVLTIQAGPPCAVRDVFDSTKWEATPAGEIKSEWVLDVSEKTVMVGRQPYKLVTLNDTMLHYSQAFGLGYREDWIFRAE